MTKISSLFIIVFLVFSFTGCQTIENASSNTSEENNLNSSSQNSVMSNLDKTLSSVNTTSSDLVENLEEISTEAYDLWISFGSSPAIFDMANPITTGDIINAYVHHQNYISEPIEYSAENAPAMGTSWIKSEAIETFGKKYFDLTTEQLQAGLEFNSEYGYMYPVPLPPMVDKTELVSINKIGNRNYEMKVLYTNNLPKELYTESELNLYANYTYVIEFTMDGNTPVFTNSIRI